MNYRTLMSATAAVGCAVALHAQTPSSEQTNRAMPGAITVTGCIERADQMAGGTASTTVDSLSFMLINATKGAAADARPSGTSGTKAEPEKGTMYRLDADTSKLNPHVGHKVEVTGKVDATAATTAQNAEPPSAANAPMLKVDSVRMLSETCARQ